MKLDEAIKFFTQKAEDEEAMLEYLLKSSPPYAKELFKPKATNINRQLAEWLAELKEWRKGIRAHAANEHTQWLYSPCDGWDETEAEDEM